MYNILKMIIFKEKIVLFRKRSCFLLLYLVFLQRKIIKYNNYDFG